jgi:hypothetical protein
MHPSDHLNEKFAPPLAGWPEAFTPTVLPSAERFGLRMVKSGFDEVANIGASRPEFPSFQRNL